MESQLFLAIVITLLAFVQAEKYLQEQPSFLNQCSINDPNLNKCMARNFQALFINWKDGLPGLNSLGALDPLLVKRIRIAQDNSRALSLNMDLQNVWVTGASKAVIQDVKLDTKRWTITGKVLLPRLDFDSDYTVKGHVLALPLNGKGKSKFSSENTLMTVYISMKLRDEGGYTFTEVESLKTVIESIGNFHLHVDNLFNGQTELEDAANTLFNENWRDLYESLRPAIEQTITKVLEDRFKKAFHYVPGNYFIGDIPRAG